MTSSPTGRYLAFATLRHLIDERAFWSKIQKGTPNECWRWMGHCDKEGYGRYAFGPKSLRRKSSSPRIAYFLHFGEDPAANQVCHRCDNPICCNPSHLFLGTAQDNAQDKANKGRAPAIASRAKLDWPLVENIRTSSEPYRVLMERYGVSKATISEIKNNKIWVNPHLVVPLKIHTELQLPGPFSPERPRSP